MNPQFNAAATKAALQARGLSTYDAAQRMGFSQSYVSRVLSGSRPAPTSMVEGFRQLLQQPSEDSDERTAFRRQFEAFLEHDRRYGGDHVADAALQFWRAEQALLDQDVDSTPERMAAVAELAEVAGWLCHSAGRFDEARHAFIECLTLARQANDLGLQWFAIDMLAMVATVQGKPGEALRLADQSLDLSLQVPGRVAVMAMVRRSRALALTGDASRSLADMTRAVGGLQDSISDHDPTWASWITPGEVYGHHGELYMSLGQPSAALPYFQRCVAEYDAAGITRGSLGNRVSELRALVKLQAWRECEDVLEGLAPLAQTVSCGMIRVRLHPALRTIRRQAPSWLSAMADDVMASATGRSESA